MAEGVVTDPGGISVSHKEPVWVSYIQYLKVKCGLFPLSLLKKKDRDASCCWKTLENIQHIFQELTAPDHPEFRLEISVIH